MLYRCENDPSYVGVEVKITKPEFFVWARREVSNFLFLYPGAKPSIDRPNADGHYEFGNMRIKDALLNRISSRFFSRFLKLQDKSTKDRIHVLTVLTSTLCTQLDVPHADFLDNFASCYSTEYLA